MLAIQPCALLLLVGPDWRVETVSANVGMLGDFRAASVVGQPLADLIGSKAIHTLRNRLSWLARDESEVQDFGVQWGDVTLDIRATRHGESYLIEAELAVEQRLPDGIGMVRSMSDRLSGSDPMALAAQAVQQMAAISGFERITLYDRRAAPIASNKGKPSEFLGETGDIARIVADREAEAVPLVGDDRNPLLARAYHLAPESLQCEELKNAGIIASMSLPLKIDGELVGAVHAHHSKARRCGAERRSVIHLFAERLVARMARQGWQP
jgi:light-regulated signal transduction histidine kinase (bacteriophytochrome)